LPVGKLTRPAALGVLAASLIALATLALPAPGRPPAEQGRRAVVRQVEPAPAVATRN
jgi:hypothetical protein